MADLLNELKSEKDRRHAPALEEQRRREEYYRTREGQEYLAASQLTLEALERFKAEFRVYLSQAFSLVSDAELGGLKFKTNIFWPDSIFPVTGSAPQKYGGKYILRRQIDIQGFERDSVRVRRFFGPDEVFTVGKGILVGEILVRLNIEKPGHPPSNEYSTYQKLFVPLNSINTSLYSDLARWILFLI